MQSRVVAAALCCWLLAGAASAQTASPAPHSVAAFAQLPFISDPDLSPDGKRLAARIAVNGEQMLGIIDLENPGNPALVPMRDNDLIDWSWVNDEWIAARLGDRGIIKSEPLYMTRVISIRADGKEVHTPALRLGGQNASIIWTAGDGSPRILMQMQKSLYLGLDFWPAVFEVDMSTGRTKQVVDPISGVYSWYADADSVVRVGIGYDNRYEQIRILYRSQRDDRFKIFDSARIDSNDAVILPALLPVSTGKAFAFSEHEGYDWMYELDLETLKVGKPAFSVAGYDLDGAIGSPSGDRVLGINVVTNRSRTHWIDPTFVAIQSSIEKTAGKGQWVSIESWSRDLKRFVVHIGSASQAGTYFLYDAGSGSLRKLGYVNESLGTTALSSVSTIRYAARDGLQIPAVLTLPRGRAAKNLPLILLPHGGPNARDEESSDYWTQFLADRGYAVIQPNYRGSTGFGNAFERAGDGEWGLKMQDDLNDAVDHVVKAGIADPKRVCVLGGSYGGYAAMHAAARDGARFRCAISFAGVSDLPALRAYDRTFLFNESSTAWLKKRVANLEAVSPINNAASVSTPILLIHGKKDLRVPVDQSRDFANVLEKAGKDVRYVELPKGDHGLTRQEDRVTFLTEVEAFLKKYNPAN